MKGDIILLQFPYTDDLSKYKIRPSLVLYDNGLDVTAAYISSKEEKYDPKCHLLIEQTHAEYPMTGLKEDSIIRLDKIFTLDHSYIKGWRGKLGTSIKTEFNRLFSHLYYIP